MSNEYDNLESQIGGIGAETPQDQPEVLGHLQHVNKPKRDLTADEEASKEAFLNRHRFGADAQLDNTYSITEGWIPIDRSLLKIRDIFYPEDWQFRVRPATVEAIKNWSSIDETNLAVTNNVFNEIMKSCVSIATPVGKLPWNKLNSWDRFWFIMTVHDYTFAKGESVLDYEEDCTECGAPIKFNLTPDALVYEFPDEDIIEKHWNREKRAWIIDPAEYDVDAPVQTLYVPTLEKDDAIFQWAYAQSQQGKQLSEPFLRFLPWLLEKAPKDPNLLDKEIKAAKKRFSEWDEEMFSFMEEVRRNITINPSEKLKQVCPNCGEEVIASVRFPNGIKSIFAVPSKHRKFGSK